MKKLYIANVVFTRRGYDYDRKCTVAFAGMNDLKNIVETLCAELADYEYEFSSVEIEAASLLKQGNGKTGERR